MQVSLNVCGSKPRTVAVESPEFLIGRAEDCDLRLESSLVSRHHCMLAVRQGRVYVRDLQSSNGTGVNNHLAVGETPLRDGDTLWVAVTPIAVHIHRTREVTGRIAQAFQAAWAPISRATGSAARQGNPDRRRHGWLPDSQRGPAATSRAPSAGQSKRWSQAATSADSTACNLRIEARGS